MRHVAIVSLLSLVAMTTATLFVFSWKERTAVAARAHADHEELVQRLGEMQRLLSAALNRSATTPENGTPSPPSASGSPGTDITANVPKPAETAEQRALREQELHAGNEMADRMIANGLASPVEFANVLRATKDLSGEERARIMGRVTAAINANQVRFDPAPHAP